MKKLIVAALSAAVAFAALAATYDLSVGGFSGIAATAGGKCYVLSKSLDFRTTNYASNDVLKLVNVPAGAKVLDVVFNVTRAEGSALIAVVGDGADDDCYTTNLNLNSAARTAAGVAKFYSASNTVQMTLGNAATNAAVTVNVIVVPTE
ncbi:MAG: hypothetical protein DRH04_06135 [Deltaproteobacteria bacterium]|nr:MAG: hypothetical protein DRH04_06135 [Deltaproteobacteria bacterium]